MDIKDLQEKITKKENQIAKMEKNLVKYVVDDEFTSMCDRYFETKDKSELEAYKKSHNMWCLPEYYSKRYDLENAKETLAKYEKQLEVQNAKQSTLSELPEVVKEFKNNLVDRWDKYDAWKLKTINEIYKDTSIKYEERSKKLREMFGTGWYDFRWMTEEQIHKDNVKDADTLVLNMIDRTIELTGKITDCKYLYLDNDNQGFTIINGIVIGEKGKARIDSIGAGGYNIQRYHIRVLVKQIK